MGQDPAANAAGGFQLGFQVTPLTEGGELDTSGDFTGSKHSVEFDPLYKMACENREGGNKLVQEGQYEQAIGRYSELIMQLRSLEAEEDVKWNDEGRLLVRKLRAATYLNLSLCFLKMEQWMHATNTATRALQGDKEPPNPAEDVLEPRLKAKALFRRASAQCEFGNFDSALADLKKATDIAPEDKAIEQMLRKCQYAVTKVTKKADKKMAGFLKKAQEEGDGGLFDDSLRPSEEATKSTPSKPSEPMKMKDGLWIVPQDEKEKAAVVNANGDINFEELSREISELKESKPDAFEELREKVKGYIEQQVAEDSVDGDDANASPGKPEAAVGEEGAVIAPPADESSSS
mmetsp:Transcript_64455/g.153842  ORF Transcript_64455/g.153842 Transcript_64455/m.153842 type:complete len:347 (+) Transcript_64455:59-1099(+)